jgi:hypothetical protein
MEPAPGAVIQAVAVNGELVRMGLQNLTNEIPKIGTLQIYRVMQATFRRSGEYPEPFPGQRYVRTYNLRYSRSLEKLENGYMLVINPTNKYNRPYGVYVLGDFEGAGQAQIHTYRWTPVRTIFDEEAASLPEEVVRALQVKAQEEASKANVA